MAYQRISHQYSYAASSVRYINKDFNDNETLRIFRGAFASRVLSVFLGFPRRHRPIACHSCNSIYLCIVVSLVEQPRIGNTRASAAYWHLILSIIQYFKVSLHRSPVLRHILRLTQLIWEAVISAENHKRQRRKCQSVTAKREKLQTLKVLTAILTLPNLA